MAEDIDRNGARATAKKAQEERGRIPDRHSCDDLRPSEHLTVHQDDQREPKEDIERLRGELEGTKSKYLDLFESAPVGYLVLNYDLIIEEINRAASILLCAERKDLRNQALCDFVSPKSKEVLFLHYQRLSDRNEKQVDTIVVQGKAENEIHIQMESTLIEGNPKKAFRSVLTDVSERKRAEEALQMANDELKGQLKENLTDLIDCQEKYRKLFNGIQSPISIYKFKYNDHGEVDHWTLEDTNASGLELLGKKSLDDVLGKNETELFGPNNRADRLPVVRQLKSNGGQIVKELYFDWSKRYVISSLVLLDADHFLSSVTDITEFKRAQSDIEESEARYRSLFENNQAPMLIIDPSTGEILDANQIASRYYGYSHEKLIKMRIQEINTLDPDVVRTEMAQSLDGSKRKFDFRHRLANGDVRDVEVYSGVIHVQGRPLLYSIVHDVSERKMIEREIVRRTDDLARSNAELQQFAYISSHDLQEPLRMVVSYLTLLDKRFSDQLDPKAKEFIKNAVEGGSRMRQLIDDLLEYSRLDVVGKGFVPVDMQRVLESTVRVLKIPIEESNADIIVGPLPTVCADEMQMIMLMQNLVGNAIKFCGTERPSVQVSAEPGESGWIFAVKDNGIGLNTEFSDKIFQMFQRLHTKDRYPGTGIGLAIAKKIVERHGGRIWVESEEGKGATFFFTIPEAD